MCPHSVCEEAERHEQHDEGQGGQAEGSPQGHSHRHPVAAGEQAALQRERARAHAASGESLIAQWLVLGAMSSVPLVTNHMNHCQQTISPY